MPGFSPQGRARRGACKGHPSASGGGTARAAGPAGALPKEAKTHAKKPLCSSPELAPAGWPRGSEPCSGSTHRSPPAHTRARLPLLTGLLSRPHRLPQAGTLLRLAATHVPRLQRWLVRKSVASGFKSLKLPLPASAFHWRRARANSRNLEAPQSHTQRVLQKPGTVTMHRVSEHC